MSYVSSGLGRGDMQLSLPTDMHKLTFRANVRYGCDIGNWNFDLNHQICETRDISSYAILKLRTTGPLAWYRIEFKGALPRIVRSSQGLQDVVDGGSI